MTEDGHSVSYRDLSEIIRIRVEELLRLIVLELPQSDYAKLIPAGLVLTGGTANLPGIAELGQRGNPAPGKDWYPRSTCMASRISCMTQPMLPVLVFSCGR